MSDVLAKQARVFRPFGQYFTETLLSCYLLKRGLIEI